MKTTLDLVGIVYDVIKNSSLKTAINGKIYKFKRPVNSNAEDVVINSLPVTNEQLQTAIVNVNVFVQNVEAVTSEGINEFPDVVRLQTLATLAVSALTDGINGVYTWDVQQQTVIQDDESDQHYINIRLQFFVSNI
jgi:hypothetical protein